MGSRSKPGFWGNLFGSAPAHERFSVEELQHLHSVLLRNPVIADSNRDTVVEALRSIAELVIWGDQHDSGMVEYFLTENLLGHFNQILQQRSNRRGNVAMQVLQTLSILIQNLRSRQTLYYLFSNNHINEIVSMRFDFDDDEVLGYYVNLLKTISLKLNETTVQFFFQAPSSSSSGSSPGGGASSRPPRSPGRPASFPLYTESIKFVNHRDPMVRTAVKTLTLNVYAIPLPAVHDFVTSRPAASYFAELATYIAEQCLVLDRLLSSWDVTSPQAQGSVEGCLAEVEDLLSYCNDVLATGVEPLRDLLLECLWSVFVGPVLFWPLIQEDVAAQHIAALTLTPPPAAASSAAASAGSSGSGGGALAAAAAGAGAGGRTLSDGGGAGGCGALQRGTVGPLCSLYVFERLFMAVTDPQLLTLLVSALLGGTACSPGSGGPSPSSSRPGSAGDDQQAAAAAAAAAARWQIPQPLLARLQYSPAAYRQALLSMLRGTDAQVAAAVVRVLGSLLQSRAVSEEQLELIGLLPQRRRKQRQLLQALVGDSPINSRVLEPAAFAGGAAEEQGAAAGEEAAAAGAAAGDAGADGAAGVCQGADGDVQGPAEQQQQSSTLACNGTTTPGGNSSGGGSGQHSRSSSRGGGREDDPAVRLSFGRAADGSLTVRLHTAGTQAAGAGSEQQPAGQQEPTSEQRQAGQPPPPEQQQASDDPQQQQQQQQDAIQQQQEQPWQQRRRQQAAAAAAEAAFADVASCLLGLLCSELLPPIALHTVAWLLNQLLSVGKGGGLLTASQKQALTAAAARHRTALQEQLQGRWADALSPLVAAEWGRCRQAVLRSRPGSVHAAVQTWMQAVLVQELRWQQGAVAGGAGAPDTLAVAAKHAYLTVQAAVAVLQLEQALTEGDVPLSAPCPAVSDADVRAGEVRESSQIALGQSQRMHCTVCFTRGQERQAYFAVEGLPAHVKAGQALDLSQAKPSLLQQVAAAAPVLLVADPGTKPETGLVLSVAPLMGALPAVDAKHGRWLHVQVRPPLRGLLKVLAASHPGNALLNMQKHLVSGHWVLAFPDADRAASAQQHVEEWAHKMRALYCQLLHPLLDAPAGSGGDQQGAAVAPGG